MYQAQEFGTNPADDELLQAFSPHWKLEDLHLEQKVRWLKEY
jgi:hypothetical protein